MRLITFLMLLLSSATLFASQGLITQKSQNDFNQTIKRVEHILNEKGMNVFTKIDHQAGAKRVDMDLPPTMLFIFGNPKVGTPLMVCQQAVAIDMPQKILIWQNNNDVFISYNDPAYLANRHTIKGCEETLTTISNALANFANYAGTKDGDT